MESNRRPALRKWAPPTDCTGHPPCTGPAKAGRHRHRFEAGLSISVPLQPDLYEREQIVPKARAHRTLFGMAAVLCVLGAIPAAAQTNPGSPVIYRNQEVFRVYGSVGPMSPDERARLASERLDRAVRDLTFNVDRLSVVHRETESELVLDDRVIGVVTDEDARGAGRSRTDMLMHRSLTSSRSFSPPGRS